jgi:ribosomal protein L20A (L18A)
MMNVLPLVLMLILMIAVITVEKLEKFKSVVLLEHQYQIYLKEKEREALNLHQARLYKEPATSQRQLPFRLFVDLKARQGKPEQFKQLRQITVDLIKILYERTSFYKELESQRPGFVNEMLDDLMASTEKLSDADKIKRIEEIQRVRLEDPVLQQAFYHMLKGSSTKQEMTMLQTGGREGENIPLSERNQEKGYYSLLDFIKYEDVAIVVQLASRELLLAIFGNEEVVEAIILKRKELSKNPPHDAESQFTNAFKGKQKPGINDELLDFKITKTDKSSYD